MKNTDLDKVVEIAIRYLSIEPEPVKDMPFLVSHPIQEHAYFSLDSEIYNVFDEPELFNKYQKKYADKIKRAGNVHGVLSFIRKPYKLMFLSEVKDYLCEADYGVSLREAYTLTEFPFQYGLDKLKALFDLSSPEHLMTPKDYEFWLSLPQELRLYRGSEYKCGMSWTLDRSKAEWFADRFNTDGKVFELVINKSSTYGYFSDRGESEIVVNPDIFKKGR